MKRKTGLIISSIGLTIIIVLCVITLSGSFNWVENKRVSIDFFAIDYISANESETLSFDAKDIRNIEIDSIEGDIRILPGNSDEILVDLVKTGWGGTKEEALATAQSLELTSSIENNTLYLTFKRPIKIFIITYQGGSNKIDITLHLPSNVPVKAKANNGDIVGEGVENSLDLEGKFGDIIVNSISGGLSVSNRDGDISISNLEAVGENVSIHSEFGDISTNNLHSNTTHLSTHDGDIEITDIRSSDALEISSEFGDISLKDFDCKNLTLKTKDGDTTLQTGEVSNELFIDSQFGNIEINHVKADKYRFEKRDGDIDLDHITGVVTANAKFGDITISHGTNITLSITTQDGNVSVSGSLNPTTNHIIQTKYGDVTLTIPQNSNFNLNVETRFGEFTSEIPINITIGPDSPTNNDKSQGIWDGQMNGGGALISISTQDGDINLESIETIN